MNTDNNNLQDGLISEIEQWVNEIRLLHEYRSSNNFNMLFDFYPVDNFSVIYFGKQKKTEKEIEDGFVDMFEKFCNRIIDTAEFESSSNRVSDELSSVSKTLYLVDWGFDIYSSIVGRYTNDEIKSKFDVSENIYQALDIVAGKRLAIARIIDPFDFIRSEIKYQTEEKYTEYPFQVNFDREYDWESLRFRIYFNTYPPDKDKLTTLIESWYTVGADEGYGEGAMSDLEKSSDWKWNEEEKFVEFDTNMGDARHDALHNLMRTISEIQEIREVRIGSGYQSWEADESLEKVVVTVKGINLDKHDPQQTIKKLEVEIKKRPHLKNFDITFDETKKVFVIRVEVSYFIGSEYVREEILEIVAALLGNYEDFDVKIIEN